MDTQEQKSWMDALPPRVLFWGGLLGGVLVLCTIGFFILLGITLHKGGDYSTTYGDQANGAAPSPSAAAPSGAQPTTKAPAAVGADEHLYGNKNAKVTLVEYSDLQCPFCKSFFPTAEQLVDSSNGQVRLVYRHFPLDSIHQFAQQAAQTAECVTSLGGNTAFWKFATVIFGNQESLSASMLLDTAAKVGVNRAAVDACVKSGKFASKVAAMQQEGNNIGVQGTPATFVVAADGSFELMPGALSYDSAKAYVDRALAK